MKNKISKIIITVSIIYIILSIIIISSLKRVNYFPFHEPTIGVFKYGESEYTETKKNIKVSLEKITNEKYFIVYSFTTGNESFFGVTLILEDINKNKINKLQYEKIFLEDNKGRKYYPIPYFLIEDFPPDNPLKWKVKFFAKFLPLPKDVDKINIYFYFNNSEFILKNVPIL